MKKYIFIVELICLFLNVAFVNAQSLALKASTAQSSATTTGNGVNWTDVVSTSLNLTAGIDVFVEATIEVEVTSGNSDIETQFRLTDGTTNSAIISRFVATKTYTDKGIVAISFVFNYGTPVSGLKTYRLQHTKTSTGAIKQFTSKAVITAIEIENNDVVPVSLPNGHGSTISTSTSSTTYVGAATTNMITLGKTADIYLVSTFSTSTSSTLVEGGWSLQESTDGTNFTDIAASNITRSVSSGAIGAATIVTLIRKGAGNYYFRLAHKVNVNTNNITTSGAAISAIALRSGDSVFPSYTKTASSVPATSVYSNITSDNITAPTNGSLNKFFMHASFNLEATVGDVVYAAYDFYSSNTSFVFTPFEIQRYVVNGSTGSGGLIGIVGGISEGTTFDASFRHKKTGGSGTLTSKNVNTIGFFLNSDPDSTLSVEEDLLNTNISVYPNPTQEQFYINNNVTNGETSFKFYTATGQLVHVLNMLPKTNTKVDVSAWASGIYILKATNNEVNIAKKLIIE